MMKLPFICWTCNVSIKTQSVGGFSTRKGLWEADFGDLTVLDSGSQLDTLADFYVEGDDSPASR
jgi:hypothetical protein